MKIKNYTQALLVLCKEQLNMKYLSILLLLLFTSSAIAGSTQTNTSGSNTAIEGGYTSTATTTYQSGSSSNTTTNSTSNSNVKSAPPSAGAPSYNSMTQDVCAVGVSLGVQTFGIGISGGKHAIDKNCERLKLARILNDFGMKVAAVAILCQDERVFESMIQAGTPCPIDGKIGKEATVAWEQNPQKRPDKDDALDEYIAQCTHESNPNREKINRDVVGAVKTIYTRKTKTAKQCKKEFYSTR